MAVASVTAATAAVAAADVAAADVAVEPDFPVQQAWADWRPSDSTESTGLI